ncbi:hypothetical protein GD627_06170 [Arthrobacter yangruifuii]|uniref:CDP-glycerol glycerophosphotransferase n=1 Tax=Arthrobacter yangruifuii TaxID=2606616 RepID=A0A5N6MQM4_9MICC|nr:CDP-glycerol glycerophosphotransferase family protein [Arthrobacter yangruifuii]KAD4007147.1 hypothetical protein GD627_06170 [Arthrobacter yangruifuii]
MKSTRWLKRGMKGLLQRAEATAAAGPAPVVDLGEPAPAVWPAPEAVPAPVRDPAALGRWLEELRSHAAVVDSDAPETAARQWYAQRLIELMPHVEALQHSGDEHFALLQKFVSTVVQGTDGQEVLAAVGVHERVMLALTAEGRRSDLLVVLADLQDHGRSYPTAPTTDATAAGQLAAEPGYLPLLPGPVEPGLLSLAPVDLPVTARLTRFEWAGDGILIIGGWAFLPGLDPEECDLDLELRQQGAGAVTALAVRREQDPGIDTAAADRWRSYAAAGFSVSVDTRTLAGLGQPGGAGEWSLQVTLRTGGGFSASDVVRIRDIDRVPRRFPVGPPVSTRTRVIGLMDAAQGLRLKTVRYSCAASICEVEGSTVTVGFADPDDVLPLALYLEAPGESRLEFRRETSGTRFTVDASPLTAAVPAGGKEKRWTLQALLPNGRTEPVGWAGSGTGLADVSDPSAALRAECTGYGYLQLSLRTERVTLSQARTDGAALILEGWVDRLPGSPAPVLPELMLRTARNEVLPSSTCWLDESGRFQTVFPLLQDKWGYGVSALEQGHYRVLRYTGGAATARVPALGHLLTDLPLHFQHELLSLEMVGEGNEQDLVLRVGVPRTTAEQTVLARSRAVAAYSQTAEPVDSGVVLFETFDGKSCSDSGRGISDCLGDRAPELQRFWTVADFSVPVPAGCIPVLRESAAWFRLLATAGYLVNNNNFPHYFRKRPGQFYLQTWHGTPLKRVGADTPIAGTTASYRALIAREAASWDILLTQNEFAAETLAAAFSYWGEPAVFGYPRNDALAAATAFTRRAEARQRLGIADGRQVLLYVPTWRDNGGSANPYLDFETATAGLGEDYVLLYRGHHKFAARRKTTGQNHYVDVTAYPEINDLYLAADLLVTDYSSAMFDFCVTGKPMYFLTPDLTQYRDSERGFYFDFESQAPGPLVVTTEDLVTAILDNAAARTSYAGRYRDFVHRYAPADDGAAAARVVDAVWG